MTALAELIALPGAPLWVAPLLCAVGLFTAALTTVLGAGGGLLLLGVMTLFLPVAVTIPVHGAIQAGANGSRLLLLWRHARASLLLAFSAGSLLGAAAGSQLLIRLPEAWLQLLLGGFILWLTWLPLPRAGARSGPAVAGLGAVTTALTLFVGATGPLVSAYLQALRPGRLAYAGTFAACMLLQHGLKIAVFVLAGFAFAPYLPFLAAMLASAVIGNWLGRALLLRLDDARFQRLLALVLTLLALRLLYNGLVVVVQ